MTEENGAVSAAEDTVPAAAEATEAETTTDTGAAPTAAEESAQDTIPEGTSAAEGAAASGTSGGDFALNVVFNHREQELSREDAVKYAQLGLLHEKQQPMLDKLSIIAAQEGKTLAEYINSSYDAAEQRMQEDCRAKAGDDNELYNQLLEFAHSKQKEKYDAIAAAEAQKAQADHDKEVERVAAEFAELQKDFEIPTFADIPQAAVQLAQRDGLSLREAYLLHLHREHAAIEAAKQTAAAAAQASTGSVHSEPEQNNGFDALLKGIWG